MSDRKFANLSDLFPNLLVLFYHICIFSGLMAIRDVSIINICTKLLTSYVIWARFNKFGLIIDKELGMLYMRVDFHFDSRVFLLQRKTVNLFWLIVCYTSE